MVWPGRIKTASKIPGAAEASAAFKFDIDPAVETAFLGVIDSHHDVIVRATQGDPELEKELGRLFVTIATNAAHTESRAQRGMPRG